MIDLLADGLIDVQEVPLEPQSGLLRRTILGLTRTVEGGHRPTPVLAGLQSESILRILDEEFRLSAGEIGRSNQPALLVAFQFGLDLATPANSLSELIGVPILVPSGGGLGFEP
jgi:hypothetical protein